MHVPRIGTQLGADLSMFSMFKLLGPIGIGAVVGRTALISRIREDAYSGGTKVQGTEAMEVLKSIVVTPVMLAIAGNVVAEVVERLNSGEIPGIAHAYLSNHQERTALVELEEPIGTAVVEAAGELGASYYPVGSASRYEIGLLVYRVSRALMEADPALASRFIRVNPFRAGPDTVLRVLRRVDRECSIERCAVTPYVQTILGPKPPGTLGRVATHEHLLKFDDTAMVLDELAAFRAQGGSTIVEVSTLGIVEIADRAHHAERLAEISRDAGVQIVAGTGFYKEPRLPSFVMDWSMERLANHMITEIREGIGGTDHRAGIIGEVGSSNYQVFPTRGKGSTGCRARSGGDRSGNQHAHRTGDDGPRTTGSL